MSNFSPLVHFIDVKLQESGPLDTIQNPYHRAAQLITDTVEELEAYLYFLDASRATNNGFGIGVIGSFPVRCAEVYRGEKTDDFMDALLDHRTFDNTLGALSKADGGGAERHEELYGLAPEYLVMPEVSSRLVHCEQDGEFFSLQPEHRKKILAKRPNKICTFRAFMPEVTSLFAARMSELGIIKQLLGKAL